MEQLVVPLTARWT